MDQANGRETHGQSQSWPQRLDHNVKIVRIVLTKNRNRSYLSVPKIRNKLIDSDNLALSREWIVAALAVLVVNNEVIVDEDTTGKPTFGLRP